MAIGWISGHGAFFEGHTHQQVCAKGKDTDYTQGQKLSRCFAVPSTVSLFMHSVVSPFWFPQTNFRFTGEEPEQGNVSFSSLTSSLLTPWCTVTRLMAYFKEHPCQEVLFWKDSHSAIRQPLCLKITIRKERPRAQHTEFGFYWRPLELENVTCWSQLQSPHMEKKSLSPFFERNGPLWIFMF